ncbi:hypothetical protein Ddc_13324 [Ditylenchus destructor]|nr:hypothetical protein Ddc_13324 [Ditylenchus destructor]
MVQKKGKPLASCLSQCMLNGNTSASGFHRQQSVIATWPLARHAQMDRLNRLSELLWLVILTPARLALLFVQHALRLDVLVADALVIKTTATFALATVAKKDNRMTNE